MSLWHNILGPDVTFSQFQKVLKLKMLVTQSCPTLCNPMDHSPPGSSVLGISQARILAWIAISFTRGSCQPRNWTHVSCLAGGFFTAEPPGKPFLTLRHHLYGWIENKVINYTFCLATLFVSVRLETMLFLVLHYHCCSVPQSSLTLCNPMACSTPGFPSFAISQSLLKLMSSESIIPSNYLVLCHPILLLTSIFPSSMVFSKKSALPIRWPNYWALASASVLLMNIH